MQALFCLNPEAPAITLDGGNLVKWKDRAIMREAVLKENRHIPKAELINRLKETLQLEHLWLIPWQPHDSSRHSDGMVRFLEVSAYL